MSEIIKKLIYFTLFQIPFCIMEAAALSSPFATPLPISYYVLQTLLLDLILFCGLYIDYKRGPAFLTLWELNLLRIYLPVLLTGAIAGCYYKEPVGITLLFIFIINMVAPAFSTNNFWFCPKCGKRYGIRIWFSNHCPRCGGTFSEKRRRHS